MLDTVPVYQMLQRIEQELVLLADSDQKKMIAYKVMIETGTPLPASASQEIVNIYRKLNNEVDLMSVDPPLSMAKVVRDLKSAEKMLSPQELTFYRLMAEKVDKRVLLSAQEIEALLRLYTNKGF